MGRHGLSGLLARLTLLLLFAGGPLWPGVAHAAPSTECPPTFTQTVASKGTFTVDLSGCSVFGLDGISTPPKHGSLPNVDPNNGNGSGKVTYVNNGDGALSDTFTILDDQGGQITFSVTVQAATSPLTVSPSSLPTPVIGQSYSATLSTTGGQAPYSYAISGLPQGLTANGGTISGTPTATGPFVVVVQVTDSTTPTALTDTTDYSFTIAEPVLTAAPPPAAAVNVPYSYQLQVSGGTPPYSNYTLVPGHGLPAGLSLSNSGLITGTPTATGTTTFQFDVYDSTTGIAPFFGTVTASITVNAVPPITLSPSTLGTLTVGVATSQTITTSGGSGVSPNTFSISAGTLPAGLSLSSSTGVLSGTPTAGGAYNFTVSVHDGGGGSGSLAYSGTVQPATVVLAPTTLASGMQSTAYNATITASGGTAPYTYTVAAGTLPNGIILSSAGVLSGTPTVYGNFPITIATTDSSGGTHYSGSRGYTLTINPSTPTIAPPTLSNPVAGMAYSQTLTASGGNAPYSFTISSGSLPPGLTLTGSTISGTPTATGAAAFTVQVTDAAGTVAVRNYSVTVTAPTITITPSTLPTATLHVAYSQPLAAQGGNAPYTFRVAGGALPTGLSLASNGTLSGSPNASGNFNFTVSAADSTTGGTYQGIHSYTMTVTAPTITTAPGSLPAATVGSAYSQAVTASGGTAPYTFAVTSGSLPNGMQLSSSGTLSGTPTAGGPANFTITATDANTNSGSTPYSLTVNAPTLNITPASGTLNAPYGSAYSQTFSGSGGTAPYTFVLSGTLPNGLSWNPGTGTLSGTPIQPGSFPVSITMTDRSTGNGPYTKTNNYTITVAAPVIVLAPAALPPGSVATAYSGTQVTASGGVAPYSYSIISGALPSGMTLSSSGTLSGTPTAAGNFNITVRATDANGSDGEQSYTLTIAPPSMTLDPASLPAATAEVPYAQTMNAVGGTAPYAYSVSSGALPAGLTLDTTSGELAGTPTVSGTFIFSISARDSSTGTGAPFSTSRSYTFTVNAPNVAITPASLPDAKVAAAYSQQFSASGGNGTYTYAVTSGSLPAGLTLGGTGQLAGTPTSAGNFTFTVTATDGGGFTGAQSYTLVVTAPTLQLTPATLPAATAEAAYAQTVSASGGDAPYTYAIASGALPAGLTLNTSSGELSGTPTVAGNFTFSLRATDSSTGAGAPFSIMQSYTLTVNAPALTLTPTTLPNAQTAANYSQQLTASGGNGTYSYAITAGTLPAGMSLNSSGLLAGKPTNAGSFSFTVTATDGLGFSGAQAYTLTVGAPNLQLTPASLPAATAETAYTQTFVASGGTAPYTYAVSAGALPAGLTLNASSGALSGTPTAAGSFTFSVSATDSSSGTGAPFSASHSYTFTVNAPSITLNPATLPNGQAAVAYSQQITASGGNGSYTFAVTSGSLPTGLSLSASGLLAGTPTAAGSFNFTVTATDGLHFSAGQAYTLVIGQPKPVAVNDTASTQANAPATIAVTSNDTGPITSIAIAQTPSHGSASVNGLNVVYTPANNYFGSDTLTYTATGPGGTSAPATVSITVNALAVPVAAPQNATTLAGKPVTINAAAGATGGPFTGAAIVTPPSSGTATVSGTDIVFTPPADASGAITFAYTLSNAFGASAPAHATVTVNPLPLPSASLNVTTTTGVPVTVDLTAGAKGGPFTAATLVSVQPANAGTATVSGSGGVYQLHFTPNANNSGTVTITFTLSNAYATSAPGTVTISVTPRSDPSKDQEVLGVLDAQADATRRFATAQISNFQQRLEALHQEGGNGGFSNGISVTSASMLRQQAGNAELASLDGSDSLASNDPTRRYLRYRSQPGDASGNQASAGNGSGSGNGQGSPGPAGLAFWTGGAVNFGSTDPNAIARGLDFTTSGVSVGADYRWSQAFASGFGIGYGHDNTDVGHNGSRSTGDSYTAAFYGSYHPNESIYVDGLVGYQWLSFDSLRYVTDDGNRVSGSRDGDQLFASLSAGYDYRHDKLKVSPYARLDVASADLDSYTEHGDAIYSLDYHKQTVKTTTTSLGVHMDYQTDTSMGSFAPSVRLEYQHDFQGAGQVTMNYADLLGGPLYRATLNQWGQDRGLFGLGATLQTSGQWGFRLEYQYLFGSGSQQMQSVLFDITKKF